MVAMGNLEAILAMAANRTVSCVVVRTFHCGMPLLLFDGHCADIFGEVFFDRSLTH
jgi:hypothetical protein